MWGCTGCNTVYVKVSSATVQTPPGLGSLPCILCPALALAAAVCTLHNTVATVSVGMASPRARADICFRSRLIFQVGPFADGWSWVFGGPALGLLATDSLTLAYINSTVNAGYVTALALLKLAQDPSAWLFTAAPDTGPRETEDARGIGTAETVTPSPDNPWKALLSCRTSFAVILGCTFLGSRVPCGYSASMTGPGL